MKTFSKLAVAALALTTALSATIADAATGTGDATATVVAPITIVAGDDLAFGFFTAPTSTGDIIYTAGGALTFPGGMSHFGGENNGTFIIGGTDGVDYSLTAPTTFPAAVTGVELTAIDLLDAGTGTFGASPHFVAVGGTLSVADTATGSHTISYDITVDYI